MFHLLRVLDYDRNHEATTIQIIVKMVLEKLDGTPLYVAENPVGLDFCVEHILKELSLMIVAF